MSAGISSERYTPMTSTAARSSSPASLGSGLHQLSPHRPGAGHPARPPSGGSVPATRSCKPPASVNAGRSAVGRPFAQFGQQKPERRGDRTSSSLSASGSSRERRAGSRRLDCRESSAPASPPGPERANAVADQRRTDELRLADSRLAGDEQETSFPCFSRSQCVSQRPKLTLTADQFDVPSHASSLGGPARLQLQLRPLATHPLRKDTKGRAARRICKSTVFSARPLPCFWPCYSNAAGVKPLSAPPPEPAFDRRCCGSRCSGRGCPRAPRRISSSDGFGFCFSSETAAITKPGVQKPHWSACVLVERLLQRDAARRPPRGPRSSSPRSRRPAPRAPCTTSPTRRRAAPCTSRTTDVSQPTFVPVEPEVVAQEVGEQRAAARRPPSCRSPLTVIEIVHAFASWSARHTFSPFAGIVDVAARRTARARRSTAL